MALFRYKAVASTGETIEGQMEASSREEVIGRLQEGGNIPIEAREAAAGKDVRLGGGVNVIQQYLRQRLIDEMHIAISPVLLGAGERLLEGINLPALGYACTRHEGSPLATHVVIERQ